MSRGFRQVATLAFLGVTAACSGKGGTDTGMIRTGAAVQSGGFVWLDSVGHGSGGHLKAQPVCHYDATTGMLVCGLARADSVGVGSGGHYDDLFLALVMSCAATGPAKEVVCTAPVGAPR